MKNILLVAENKPSMELLEYIDGMVESNNQTIRYKINQVKRVNKDKDKYPQLLIGNKVIADINMIYIYLTKDGAPQPRRRRDMGDPYQGLNFEDMLDAEIDFDDEGKPVRGQDHDDEQAYYKRRGGDDSEEEPHFDLNAVTQKFNEKRGRIERPTIRKPKRFDDDEPRPKRRDTRRDEDDDRGYRSKIKSRKSKYADESSYTEDDSEIMHNGKEQLEDFYMKEAKSRGQD